MAATTSESPCKEALTFSLTSSSEIIFQDSSGSITIDAATSNCNFNSRISTLTYAIKMVDLSPVPSWLSSSSSTNSFPYSQPILGTYQVAFEAYSSLGSTA